MRWSVILSWDSNSDLFPVCNSGPQLQDNHSSRLLSFDGKLCKLYPQNGPVLEFFYILSLKAAQLVYGLWNRNIHKQNKFLNCSFFVWTTSKMFHVGSDAAAVWGYHKTLKTKWLTKSLAQHNSRKTVTMWLLNRIPQNLASLVTSVAVSVLPIPAKQELKNDHFLLLWDLLLTRMLSFCKVIEMYCSWLRAKRVHAVQP